MPSPTCHFSIGERKHEATERTESQFNHIPSVSSASSCLYLLPKIKQWRIWEK
jgi:hypothetical protein